MTSLTSSEWVFLDSIPEPRESDFYRCIIVCPDKQITITANLPAEYQLDLGATYSSPFTQAIADKVYSGAKNTAGAFGLQFATKAMTGKIWQSSNELTFSIPMVFQVEDDPYEDVLKPLADLYSLVLSETEGPLGTLKPPGPVLDVGKVTDHLASVVSHTAGSMGSALGMKNSSEVPASSVSASDPTAALMTSLKNNCFLYIGHHQFFSSIIVTNISETVSVLPLIESGVMSRIEVNVTFATMWVPTRSDIKDLLLGSDRGKNASGGSSSSGMSSSSASPRPESTQEQLSSMDTGSDDDADYQDVLANSGVF